ncbi:hypothetical protein FQA47_019959 [Oryzias melastigma]|uniref:NADP-dependent oxidoreductase domain-containing protein n=1 Tax=Oryzias melastigma TaxID=30732 RepID=A0A834FJQ3_ORYME|nr:hypothetical protein FQA47_019959 [Oryzias melastigma]
MSSVPKVKLAGGLEVCRILNGMWQVSGAHGTVNTTRAVEAMQAYTDAGLTTFDMADIYGPAEDIFGQFSSQRGPADTQNIDPEFTREMVPNSVSQTPDLTASCSSSNASMVSPLLLRKTAFCEAPSP